jgi:hypothetical protein
MRLINKQGFAPSGMCYDPITAVLMVASLGMTAMSISENNKNAKAQKAALEQEKNLKVAERQKQTKMMLSRQKVSFLNSGISLIGGTPEAVFNDTLTTGAEDVNQIRSNYSTAQANVASQARSQMLAGLGSMAGTAASYGVASGWGQSPKVTATTPSLGSGWSINEASPMAPSNIRPYSSPKF